MDTNYHHYQHGSIPSWRGVNPERQNESQYTQQKTHEIALGHLRPLPPIPRHAYQLRPKGNPNSPEIENATQQSAFKALHSYNPRQPLSQPSQSDQFNGITYGQLPQNAVEGTPYHQLMQTLTNQSHEINRLVAGPAKPARNLEAESSKKAQKAAFVIQYFAKELSKCIMNDNPAAYHKVLEKLNHFLTLLEKEKLSRHPQVAAAKADLSLNLSSTRSEYFKSRFGRVQEHFEKVRLFAIQENTRVSGSELQEFSNWIVFLERAIIHLPAKEKAAAQLQLNQARENLTNELIRNLHMLKSAIGEPFNLVALSKAITNWKNLILQLSLDPKLKRKVKSAEKQLLDEVDKVAKKNYQSIKNLSQGFRDRRSVFEKFEEVMWNLPSTKVIIKLRSAIGKLILS